jgi:FHS family Na+ dependent glucose MFS transporter 1
MRCFQTLSLKGWTRRELCISAWATFSFVGLGICGQVFGPTIIDLAARNNVDISAIAGMMFVRSIGGILGAIGSGILCDKVHRFSLWMTCTDIVLGASLTFVIPLSDKLPLLGVLMFFHGIMFGGLSNGIHALLFNVLKGKDTGPILQLLHFMYALGAFLSPLVTRPFLTDENSLNSTSSCYCNATYDNCSIDDFGSGSSPFNASCPPSYSETFHYAYWLVTIPLLLSLPGLLAYAIKDQCLCIRTTVKETNIGNATKDKEMTPAAEDRTYPNSLWYLIPFMSLLFFFVIFYVALEMSYGIYVFTFAVKGDLQFPKPKAAVLSSVFFGTFSFFRLFTVALSLCKMSPSFLIAGNLSGSLLASLILTIWSYNEIAVWIGTGLLGMSFASIFPNIVVFLTKHGPATGRATSVLSTGAVLGEISIPVAVGIMIDKLSPISLIYLMLTGTLLCVCIFITLLILTRLCRVKRLTESKKYELLQFEEEEINNELVLDDNTETSTEL